MRQSHTGAVTNLGRLPTLGLNQLRLDEFETVAESMNLFKVHNNTEKLFIQRELEREFKDINRFDKLQLKVHEKSKATSSNRAGTIRMINDIPALRQDGSKRRAARSSSHAIEDSTRDLNSPG